jgi:Amt family ammonium transporter
MAMAIIYPRTKKWDLGITINGFLGGLVAITAPCYWVSPFGAMMIGLIAAPVVVIGIDLLERLRIDDPIGAWPVHGLAGIWGTLSIGLFATGQFGIPGADGPDTTTKVEGLFYGGGLDQLKAQFIGSFSAVVAVSAMSIVVMFAVKAIKQLRVEEDGELEGLDLFEHGTPAYHVEFGQGMTYSAPLGTSPVVTTEDGDDDELERPGAPVSTPA